MALYKSIYLLTYRMILGSLILTHSSMQQTDGHAALPMTPSGIAECDKNMSLLWAPAQRKRATMLYFANVFLFFYFFMAALFSGPG